MNYKESASKLNEFNDFMFKIKNPRVKKISELSAYSPSNGVDVYVVDGNPVYEHKIKFQTLGQLLASDEYILTQKQNKKVLSDAQYGFLDNEGNFTPIN